MPRPLPSTGLRAPALRSSVDVPGSILGRLRTSVGWILGSPLIDRTTTRRAHCVCSGLDFTGSRRQAFPLKAQPGPPGGGPIP